MGPPPGAGPRPPAAGQPQRPAERPDGARPAGASAAPTRPTKAAPELLAPDDAEEDFDFDEELDDVTARWVSLVATVGLALVAVVGAQVVASILEGFVVSSGKLEPRGVPTDLLHRLGFPFGNLGPTAMLLLVLGLALMCLPGLLGQDVTPLQDRLIRIALVLIVVLAAIVAVGSLLAVRYSLHEYTAQGQNPPQFIRVGFASFLLGTLGTSATALFGSLAAMSLRRRRP